MEDCPRMGTEAVEKWAARGKRQDVGGYRLFVIDEAAEREEEPPLLVLHGFPSASFDWRHVLDRWRLERRVSSSTSSASASPTSPTSATGSALHADVAEAVVGRLGLDGSRCSPTTWATRSAASCWPATSTATLGFAIGRRVLTNGCIYLAMAQLTAGQQAAARAARRALRRSAPTAEPVPRRARRHLRRRDTPPRRRARRPVGS